MQLQHYFYQQPRRIWWATDWVYTVGSPKFDSLPLFITFSTFQPRRSGFLAWRYITKNTFNSWRVAVTGEAVAALLWCSLGTKGTWMNSPQSSVSRWLSSKSNQYWLMIGNSIYWTSFLSCSQSRGNLWFLLCLCGRSSQAKYRDSPEQVYKVNDDQF